MKVTLSVPKLHPGRIPRFRLQKRYAPLFRVELRSQNVWKHWKRLASTLARAESTLTQVSGPNATSLTGNVTGIQVHRRENLQRLATGELFELWSQTCCLNERRKQFRPTATWKPVFQPKKTGTPFRYKLCRGSHRGQKLEGYFSVRAVMGRSNGERWPLGT